MISLSVKYGEDITGAMQVTISGLDEELARSNHASQWYADYFAKLADSQISDLDYIYMHTIIEKGFIPGVAMTHEATLLNSITAALASVVLLKNVPPGVFMKVSKDCTLGFTVYIESLCNTIKAHSESLIDVKDVIEYYSSVLEVISDPKTAFTMSCAMAITEAWDGDWDAVRPFVPLVDTDDSKERFQYYHLEMIKYATRKLTLISTVPLRDKLYEFEALQEE